MAENSRNVVAWELAQRSVYPERRNKLHPSWDTAYQSLLEQRYQILLNWSRPHTDRRLKLLSYLLNNSICRPFEDFGLGLGDIPGEIALRDRGVKVQWGAIEGYYRDYQNTQLQLVNRMDDVFQFPLELATIIVSYAPAPSSNPFTDATFNGNLAPLNLL